MADKKKFMFVRYCNGCPYAEVIENLESIHGALLRMNKSIQAERTLKITKTISELLEKG